MVMDPNSSCPRERHAEREAASGDAHVLAESRRSERRLSQTIHSLQDTIAILRAGANSLAIDNALLQVENERLRVAARERLSKRG